MMVDLRLNFHSLLLRHFPWQIFLQKYATVVHPNNMQARWKEGAHAGEPTVLRMTDGNGEMNPNFPKVEMHEINENHSGILKYHVSNQGAE